MRATLLDRILCYISGTTRLVGKKRGRSVTSSEGKTWDKEKQQLCIDTLPMFDFQVRLQMASKQIEIES